MMLPARVLLPLLVSPLLLLASDVPDNTLAPAERSAGWQLLFDGKTMTHWIDPSANQPPGDAWSIDAGCLHANPHPTITEDLVSAAKYSDFELQWDWKIARGANSGVKYRIRGFVPLSAQLLQTPGKKFEDKVQSAIEHRDSAQRSRFAPGEKAQVYVVGFEYQMIDNALHPDALHGPAYQTGALYSILGPSQAAAKPAGEFNHSRLVVKGKHVEHWLNGIKVIDTELDTKALKQNLAHRWGADSGVYHMLVDQPAAQCPFSLQNHGDAAWFKNIKIKPL